MSIKIKIRPDPTPLDPVIEVESWVGCRSGRFRGWDQGPLVFPCES